MLFWAIATFEVIKFTIGIVKRVSSIMIVLVIVAVLILLFVAMLLVISYTASAKLASPPRKKLSWTPRDLGLDFVDFTHTTRDGVTLKGWLVRGHPEKAVILIHGYTSSKWDEGYIKPALNYLGKLGYTVLAVDMRAHGESGGAVTTLGYKESDDVVELVNYLRKAGYKRVCLYGFSMGGAISIMASTKVNIDAIVLDSPYVDIRTSGKRWVNRVRGPLRFVLKLSHPVTVKLTTRKIGVKPDELVMYKYASNVRVPVLLIAPLKDDLISVDEYRALERSLKSSSKHVEAWYVDTTHVGAWSSHREENESKLKLFLETYL